VFICHCCRSNKPNCSRLTSLAQFEWKRTVGKLIKVVIQGAT
jgi:hypothetical protein